MRTKREVVLLKTKRNEKMDQRKVVSQLLVEEENSKFILIQRT